ncbi:unnamed protein product, partial [Closterium sp. Naga37s-1]
YTHQVFTPGLNTLEVAVLLAEVLLAEVLLAEVLLAEGAVRHRVLVGLKEVGQAVHSGRAKCVVLAAYVEPGTREGGDERLETG